MKKNLLLLIVFISLISCGENSFAPLPGAPVVTGFSLSNRTPFFGEVVTISVNTNYSDNTEFEYQWLCTGGEVLAKEGSSIFWKVPSNENPVVIIVFINSGNSARQARGEITITPSSKPDFSISSNEVLDTETNTSILFEDSFENGEIDWNVENIVQVTDVWPHNGNYGVRLGTISKEISTEGFLNLSVSFYMGVDNLEAGESARVLWSDDSGEYLLLEIFDDDPLADSTLHPFSITLPSAAELNPRFQLKFSVNADSSGLNDRCFVDDVLITGDSLIPDTIPGMVYFSPPYQKIRLADNFSFETELFIDTGVQKAANYYFTITYDVTHVEIAGENGNSGVSVGAGGFLSYSNTSIPGQIVVSGIDLDGKGPGHNIPFLKFSWKALKEGFSLIEPKIAILSDQMNNPLGTPVSLGAGILVE